ncbi:hypothetical protein RI367_003982 [Sorochytrium milnesiophthora]
MSLRLRTNVASGAERKQLLADVLRTLNLEKAKDTVIGSSEIKGISGGERKRTAIGMELVADPQVLLLDECTTGLDAFTAFNVLRVLKGLANAGKTIVATLHQPSSEIFHIIDDVIVLADGMILYAGPTKELVGYFSSVGYKCPRYTNPLDYVFMNVINNTDCIDDSIDDDDDDGVGSKGLITSSGTLPPVPEDASLVSPTTAVGPSAMDDDGIDQATARKRMDLQELIEYFKTSPMYRDRVLQKIDQSPQGGITHQMIKHRAPFTTQFAYLAGRAWRNASRNKLMVQARAAQAIVLSVFIGLVYLNINKGQSDEAVAQSITGALFFVSVNQFFSMVFSVLSIFSTERFVFQREFGSGYYGVTAYYLSKIVVEFPFQIAFPLIFATITFWLVHFSNSVVEWLLYCVFIALISMCGGAFGIFITSCFKEIGIALTIAPLCILPMMMYGGLLVNNSSSPKWLSWMQWISPVQYSFTGMMRSHWHRTNLHTLSGEAVLDRYGLQHKLSVGINIVFLLILYFAFTLLAYFGLRRIAYEVLGGRSSDRNIRQKLLAETQNGNGGGGRLTPHAPQMEQVLVDGAPQKPAEDSGRMRNDSHFGPPDGHQNGWHPAVPPQTHPAPQ